MSNMFLFLILLALAFIAGCLDCIYDCLKHIYDLKEEEIELLKQNDKKTIECEDEHY